MATSNSISKIEKGRAEFAYKCAKEGVEIKEKKQINGDFYIDGNYVSYVRKITSMVISNGLGQTIAFIYSKRKKEKNNKKPGSEDNPKNAYDLIYEQLAEYFKSEYVSRIKITEENSELVKWIISLDSYQYRYVTEEVLALMKWLKRFAEGLSAEYEIEEGAGKNE